MGLVRNVVYLTVFYDVRICCRLKCRQTSTDSLERQLEDRISKNSSLGHDLLP